MKDKNKLLIIDDEEDFCFFIKANLEARGDYKVRTATSGDEGLQMAESFQPHLILLDIIMPGMHGFEVLKRLKENDKTMHIPALMLTAKLDEDSRKTASGLYCDGYVTKPVQIEDLLARIEKTLSLRRLK